MGAFTNSAITDAGRALLAEAQAGAVFTPTRIVIGSGSIPAGKTAQTMTDVVAVVKSLAINKKQRTPDGKAIFGAVYSNEDITEAFYFRELALYAKPVHLNEDGSVASEGAEVLYTYGNAGDSADYMPAYSTSTVVEKQLDIVTYVGNDTQVNLTVESGVYASKAELDAVANGAVNKDGDTMTGHLKVQSDGAPNAIKMYTEPNGAAFVGIMEDDEIYKFIRFLPSNVSPINTAHFVSNVTGEYTEYPLIHTGNKRGLITAEDVGAMPVIQGISTLNSSFNDTTPIQDIIDTMPDKSMLIHDVAAGTSANIYPAIYGTLMIYKLRVNRVVAQFASNLSSDVVGNTRLWFGQSNAGSFMGWHEVASTVYAVPTTRKVNGKVLSSDIALVAADVGAAITATYTATVTTSWTASGDYYYQDITVDGILASDTPVVDIVCGSDNAANKVFSENMCKVFRITTSANKIRVWATEAISTAFPIQLKVVR